jgi:hypothetical protein|tara:strand:+ start:430 stop:666 length:237 start_codon:yes stop_codon:yes gene_type:complete
MNDTVNIGSYIQDALLNQTVHSIIHTVDSVTINTVAGHSVAFMVGPTYDSPSGSATYQLHADVKIVTRHNGRAKWQTI